MTPANKLTAELLIEIPKQVLNIRIWRNNRVDATLPGRNGILRRVQAGINGQGDISGIAGPTGVRVEIEVKAGKDRMSDIQKAFAEMILSHGGIYIVARSVEGCIAELRLRLSLRPDIHATLAASYTGI